MATTSTRGSQSSKAVDELRLGRLKDEVMDLGKAIAHDRATRLSGGVDALTSRLHSGGGKGAGKGAEKMTDKMDKATDESTAKASSVGSEPGAVSRVAHRLSPLRPVRAAASGTKRVLSRGHEDEDQYEDEEQAKGTEEEQGEEAASTPERRSDPKVTTIIESVDVPVSRDVAYRQWTLFEDFPHFMKKVEMVHQDSPEEVTWKAQIWWSHRTWPATIPDQVSPEIIVWTSRGKKGHVDGAVTFHELAPDLTRVLVTLEYHPKGLMEHTANVWRAQGRRVRAELKQFRRHVANHTLLHQEDVKGWAGEIHEAETVERKQRRPSRTSAAVRTGGRSTTPRAASTSGTRSGSRSGSKASASKPSASKPSASKPSASKSSASKSSASKSSASKSSGTSAKRSTGTSSGRSTRSRKTTERSS